MSETPHVEIVIVGAGGHARMLIDALQAAGESRAIGLLDANPERRGTRVLGVPIVGDDAALATLAAAGTRWFAVGLGSPVNGNLAPRRALYEAAVAHGLTPLTIVHPTAVVSRYAEIGGGAQLLPLAVVNAAALVGANTIVNSGAVVEHDCVVGDHAHIATGARLTSAVTVGDGAHVGAGAIVRQGIRIGARAVVGAGAVVVADVRDGVVVAGVPARPLVR